MSASIALLPNEDVVMTSDKNVVTLTTRRVRYDSASGGRSSMLSMTLDAVASCGLVTTSYPVLLILAVLAVLGAFTQKGDGAIALFVAGIILAVLYAVTRRAVLSIESTGGQRIAVPATAMKREAIVAFIDAVEREKLAYLALVSR